MRESPRTIRERESLSYRLLPGEERRYTERDGVKLSWSFYPAKEKSRGVLVLLHGVASNGSRYEEFAETCSQHRHWDIVRMDLRGHAGSVANKVATLETWSADVAQIIRDLGVDKVLLLGHSLGAQIAMRFAVLYPELLKGLILLDPLVSQAYTQKTYDIQKKKPIVHSIEKSARFLNLFGLRRKLVPQNLREKDAVARVMIAKGGADFQAFIERYSSPKFDVKLIHMAQYMRDIIETGRPTPDSECFKSPTLVLAAKNGTYVKADIVQSWVEAMDSGELVTVPCAHWPLTECPDAVSAAIDSWTERHFS